MWPGGLFTAFKSLLLSKALSVPSRKEEMALLFLITYFTIVVSLAPYNHPIGPLFWGGVLQTGLMESLPSTSKPPAVQWVGVGDPHGPCFVFCDLNPSSPPTRQSGWVVRAPEV